MTAERTPFDLAGPLPTGLTVLEASAGTGKTFTLSALAVRYVAEWGIPASALCIVSFTEAATAEIRGRVRRRLAEVADALEAATGVDAEHDDEVVAAVAAGCTDTERAQRTARLRAAVTEFDAATITTIHGFCGRVLALGGDPIGDGPASRSAADVDEVVNDLLLACAAPSEDGGPLGLDQEAAATVGDLAPARVVEAVRAALQLPDADLLRLSEPEHPGPDAGDRLRKRFDKQRPMVVAANAAARVVEQATGTVIARRQRARRRTVDRVVVDARDLLVRPESLGLVAALRQRYRVVLIDEFQDTDRVQWELFRRAFVGGPDAASVVLVGDPKQSIYRFRGAELSAYLDAVAHADAVHTLARNWRSDEPVLRGLEVLLGGVTFGSDDVVFQPVAAAPDRTDWALSPHPEAVFAPIDVRVVPRPAEGTLKAPDARAAITADLVATVGRLLGQGSEITDDDGPRRLRAGDIAVLTRSNHEASSVVAALAAAGIAAATSGATSVVETEAWAQWRRLLLALEQPSSSSAVRAAAVGWFGGHSLADLAVATDVQLAELHDRFRSWATLLASRGIPALLAAACAHGVQDRLLARHGGERDLTDLEHIAELLQGATGGRPAPAGALRRLVDSPDVFGSADDGDSVVTRRIDRDDDAVQVFTIHRSKGLEFGVVLCPFLWPKGRNTELQHAVLDGRRVISSAWVAGVKPDAAGDLEAAYAAEASGEQRRRLYVALTRARHGCVLWWAPLDDQHTSVLGDVLAQAAGLDGRPRSAAELHSLAAVDPLVLSVSEMRPAGSVAALTPPEEAAGPTLDVASTTRVVDRAWRIWSFSSIKAAGDDHDAPVLGGVDEPSLGADGRLDGEIDAETAAGTDAVTDAVGRPHEHVPGPLATAPGGTEFGTLVHHVLEEVDFTSRTLIDDLTDRCADALRHRRLRVGAEDLAVGLAAAIAAPLGGPLGALRLADLDRRQRLDELVFDLPLGRLSAGLVGEVLADHLPPDDLLRPWARHLAASGNAVEVEGMLTGSIDLVARTADGARFWVADYKTNQLGQANTYGQLDLAQAMAHHDYPLQAVLYQVALHRFLRWRLPGYEPDEHLLGAAYLFLRGMVPADGSGGESRHQPGVFWWRPPTSAIVALDHLLATGVVR